MTNRLTRRALARPKLVAAAALTAVALGGLLPFDRLPAGAGGTVGVSGTVAGTAFRDYDADGVRDALEPGEPGVEVRAFDTAGELVGAVALTDGDGRFVVTVAGAATAPFVRPSRMREIESRRSDWLTGLVR